MKKEKIELIILKVTVNNQTAINLKIYKDGTIVRSGVGGLPPIGITGKSFSSEMNFFEPLIKIVPEEIVESSYNYEEKTPNGYIEYVMIFYGVSNNRKTNEEADWDETVGIRFKLDLQTEFQHQLITWMDSFILEAVEFTNDWYFDIMINAVYGLKSSKLPSNTMISTPKTKEEIEESFSNYVNQIRYSSKKWNIEKFVKDKYFEPIEGVMFKGIITQKDDKFNIKFEDYHQE